MAKRAPADIADSTLAGPFPVGRYAVKLKERLREFERVQLLGELWNLRESQAKFYFELRDRDGALPCSIWRTDWEKLEGPLEKLRDGAQVVIAGGCDYYPGSSTSSPSFTFEVSDIRIAGEGDLLAQIERLRELLDGEGLLQRQQTLPRPALPRSIGIVTGESGKARGDLSAALARRGWQGRLVWGFAPVQDRHAAPAITKALQDLSAVGEVEVIVVARGGGSLADLLAFCDETLCRTVALLPVPVITSIGHHTDRTLLDDVAAVSCSTPTHAAEVAVPVDVGAARTALRRSAERLQLHARQAVGRRRGLLGQLARAPLAQLRRERERIHKLSREIRASTTRRAAADRERIEWVATLLRANDPERTLERGYAIVTGSSGTVVHSAADARKVGAVDLRFSDGSVSAEVNS